MSRLLSTVFLMLFLSGVVHAAEPSITDYWRGSAVWTLVRSYVTEEMKSGLITDLGPGFSGGVRIKVVGKTWYLFRRGIETETPLPAYCPDQGSRLLSILVSQSTDEGVTWSKPVSIIKPQENSAMECGVTDGDVYFNSKQNQWHFLFQCLSRKGWQGCYAKKKGKTPLGEFEMDARNPVIVAGALWSKVCNKDTDKCAQWAGGINKIFDEGTFDIFDFVNGYYFIDYHGYDGIHGYRGLIKTKDFHKWEVVANGSLLNKSDALKFNVVWDEKGPIGFGAGQIVKDKGFYYLISEAADRNLNCTPGQNWVWGMFRTKSLKVEEWESYPSNPFFTVGSFPVQDEEKLPCYPAYLGLFVSQTGHTYLHASLVSRNPRLNGVYLYKLVKKPLNAYSDSFLLL